MTDQEIKLALANMANLKKNAQHYMGLAENLLAARLALYNNLPPEVQATVSDELKPEVHTVAGLPPELYPGTQKGPEESTASQEAVNSQETATNEPGATNPGEVVMKGPGE